LAWLVFHPFINAQNEGRDFVSNSTYLESVRNTCDEINYDWNHKTGKFNFIFYYQLNWETFNGEIYHILDRFVDNIPEPEIKKQLRREIDDRIWETDRKSGDYKPLAIKMAWKIDHDFMSQAVEQAYSVQNWGDFIKIRELYHLDKDLTILEKRLDREFNKANLISGLGYLAGVNNWDDEFIEDSKKQILKYEDYKIQLLRKCNEAEISTIRPLGN